MKKIARHPQTTLKKIHISLNKVNLSTPLKFEPNLKTLWVFSVLFQIFLLLLKKCKKNIWNIFQRFKIIRLFFFFLAECPDFALYKAFFPRKTSHFAPKSSDLADLKGELLVWRSVIIRDPWGRMEFIIFGRSSGSRGHKSRKNYKKWWNRVHFARNWRKLGNFWLL